MTIAEAKSFHNGIEFYLPKKGIVISSTRDEKGNLVLEQKNVTRISNKNKEQRLFAVLLTLLYLVASQFLFPYISVPHFPFFFFLILAWISIIGYYKVRAYSLRGQMESKYHAAEHKVLNYMDTHHTVPTSIEELQKMPSISIRCGSTLLAVVLVAITLCSISIILVPFLFFKIVTCLACLALTFYWWGIGKCDFLQKMVIKEPTKNELEVAFYGFKSYWEQYNN